MPQDINKKNFDPISSQLEVNKINKLSIEQLENQMFRQEEELHKTM